jgi:hypothetical protein
MVQQTDDARQSQRRAESQTAKLRQQRDQLQNEITELRMQVNLQARELKERSTALAAATEHTAQSAPLAMRTYSNKGLLTRLPHLANLERQVAANGRSVCSIKGHSRPASRDVGNRNGHERRPSISEILYIQNHVEAAHYAIRPIGKINLEGEVCGGPRSDVLRRAVQ